MADLNIGINVVAGPAKKALNDVSKATEGLSKSIGKAQASTQKMGKQFNSTAVSTNKFAKGAMQQAGYQIADFAVQVQNGTSAVQAFGQQGSQMLAVFGPAGAILGAVVAVGSALTTVFLGLRDASQSSKDAVKELTKSFDDLASTYNTSVKSSLDSAREAFGGISEGIIQLLDAQRDLAEQSKMKDFADQVEFAMKSLKGSSRSVESLFNTFAMESGAATDQAKKNLSKLQTLATNNLGLTGDSAKAATDNLRGLFHVFSSLQSGKLSLDEIKEASVKLNGFREGLVAAGVETKEYNEIILQLSLAAAKLQKQMGEGIGIDGSSMKETLNQINNLARQEVQSAERAARARKKEADERARQAVKLAAGEVRAAQAATRAREREDAERKASREARDREAKAIFEAEQRRVKSIEKAYSDSLASINKETEALKIQNQLFGQSEEAIKAQVDFLAITAALKEKGKNLTLEELDAIHAQLKARGEEFTKLKAKTEEQKLQAEREKATDAALKKINAEREKAQKRINQLIGDGFRTASDAIAGLISGTNTWREALTQVLRKVIDIAAQMGTTKSGGFSFDKLFGAVGGLFSGGPSFSPVSQAGPIGPGGVQTFHTGGVVGRNSGPIGPRSDERLIMARTGERVLNRGEAMGSAGGGGVVVNQTINLSTGVQQTVRAEVMSLAPQIAAQAKAAVLDAKKRGGGFGAAFA